MPESCAVAEQTSMFIWVLLCCLISAVCSGEEPRAVLDLHFGHGAPQAPGGYDSFQVMDVDFTIKVGDPGGIYRDHGKSPDSEVKLNLPLEDVCEPKNVTLDIERVVCQLPSWSRRCLKIWYRSPVRLARALGQLQNTCRFVRVVTVVAKIIDSTAWTAMASTSQLWRLQPMCGAPGTSLHI